MYSGVSGMSAHQTKLNVIGNNIANVNTYGFKASRVVFSDVLYQNLGTAAAPRDAAGGVNSSQLGYGTKVGTIDVINTLSSGADTGRALDVYINGEGYLPAQTSDGTLKYTRVGNLKFDIEGNLTDGSGSLIYGIPTNYTGYPELGPDGTLDVSALQAIKIDPVELEKCTGINIGISGEITAIKSVEEATFVPAMNTEWLNSIDFSDITDSGFIGGVTASIVAGTPNTATFTALKADGTSATGVMAGGTITFTNGTKTMTLNIDQTKYNAFLSGQTASSDTTMGNVVNSGNIPVTLGYLSIAKFANPDGLIRDGDGYYQASANSGNPVATKAGTKGTGSIKSSSLEMSNVDLSKEFTEMIIAQRGFQANTRLVTVSDSILEELINLKR